MRLILNSLLATICLTIGLQPARAQECDLDACIEVSAGGKGDLLITVKKGRDGTSSTSAPAAPKATRTPSKAPVTPRPKPTFTSTSGVSPSPAPRPTQSRRPATTPTPRPKVSKSPSVSLMEQVRRMLPSGILITQPYAAFLVREPIYFMTTIPEKFETVIVVLDVPVRIKLTAEYKWNFGDGHKVVTDHPGAPYPIGRVRHTYLNPGEKQLSLEVVWTGTWSAGTISGPIKGSMTTEFERKLMIRTADTRLNQ